MRQQWWSVPTDTASVLYVGGRMPLVMRMDSDSAEACRATDSRRSHRHTPPS